MEYNFSEIEKRWQQYWAEKKTFRALNPDDPEFGKRNFKGKYYVLDMFPYPSGAGLHVGHPLGYIASDIAARYKRHCGYNVLHPMGYDSFGLPAEQYAIQTGQHPAITTEQNINRYREQLDKIGFSFDWDRQVKTSDPNYYKWTQWIFLKLFHSWYNTETDKAEPIEMLIERFRNQESRFTIDGTKKKWDELNEKEQSDVLMEYRLAYLSEAWVNWCPALGTVLANDEVKDGVSERGGHPVERKRMPQWSLRITAYAERLLKGLDTLDWSESIKEAQRNWIGRSEGSSLKFHLSPGPSPQERGGVSEGERHGNILDSKASDQKDFYTTNGQYWNLLIDKAKAMRSNPTPAEAALWNLLRAKTTGFKFRRQHIINRFIVDFVCLEKMLVIEVDGDIHDLRQEQDTERSQILNELGFDVIRFRNEEVFHQPDNVIESIVTELKKRNSYPASDDQIQIIKDGHEEYSVSAGGLANPSPEGRAGEGFCIEVFTTRPDTVYGVTFLTLAPENDLVLQITTDEFRAKVEEYIHYAKNRSERERQADVKKITGQFTGAYAIHPFTNEKIPVWVGEYVLAGYGTGAVMGVPAHDTRDYAFARHFNLPIKKVIQPDDPALANEECFDTYDGKCINSDLINGLEVKDAIKKIIAEIEKRGLGKGKVNYRLRDAIFGRQRYWGEPIPVYYHLSPNPSPQERGEMIPCAVDEKDLPVELPEVDKYLPTETGEPPLARAEKWKYKGKFDYEQTTMPGWAGSSWYFLRYMDAENENEFASKEATDYWQQVDLYIGGSEHATGHLLYFRFWTKFLKDLGYITIDEPAQKLINQGMIQGVSEKVYMPKSISSGSEGRSETSKMLYYFNTHITEVDKFLYNAVELDFADFAAIQTPADFDNFRQIVLISAELINDSNREKVVQLNMDSRLFENSKLDLKRFFESEKLLNKNNPEANHIYILVNDNGTVIRRLKDKSPLPEDFEFKSVPEVEKMSKSKRNVITPDTDPETGQPGIIEQYGADCLRMYEMFLGPLEQHKPWNTNGITGVFNFLKKMWRLYNLSPDLSTQSEADAKALKVLHRTIKKITEDIENYSFNTAVSAFMICVNELTDLKCTSKEVLEKLCILISPFAPHLAEELWQNKLGNKESVAYAGWPKYEEQYLVEDSYEYPVSINGKTRFKIPLSLKLTKEEVEQAVLAADEIKKYIQGNPKKVIVVPGRIVNVVV